MERASDHVARREQPHASTALLLVAAVGICAVVGGFWAFSYAHYHNPYREDPMAVHVLSPSTYGWMHPGGLALIAFGGVLLLFTLVMALYYAE
ncbi:MAG TPA: hypothetical protein VK691_10950 [Solirubrobacteraceae bacterium]|jgi:hypothetical protein|nr:hypothetical protein [Solirubrobacteraceae bacterium]